MPVVEPAAQPGRTDLPMVGSAPVVMPGPATPSAPPGYQQPAAMQPSAPVPAPAAPAPVGRVSAQAAAIAAAAAAAASRAPAAHAPAPKPSPTVTLRSLFSLTGDRPDGQPNATFGEIAEFMGPKLGQLEKAEIPVTIQPFDPRTAEAPDEQAAPGTVFKVLVPEDYEKAARKALSKPIVTDVEAAEKRRSRLFALGAAVIVLGACGLFQLVYFWWVFLR